MSISDESVRLRIVRDILGHAPRSRSSLVRLGVQDMDDAALIKISDSKSLVIASDFVRGSQFYLFELGYMDYFDVGYYLVVANISDIAAMGAEPFCITTIIRYAKGMRDDEFRRVFQGIAAAADVTGVEVVGGDIGSYRTDVFAATAFGFIETSKALLRSGAKPGDILCVTGTVGLPITAVLYFKRIKQRGLQLSPSEEERLLASWRRPCAKVRHGLILSRERIANSCQDISDGLKATIEQLGAASGVSFNIYADRLPIDDSTQKLAEFVGVAPAQIAISASVDFELMFTVSPDSLQRCRDALGRAGLECWTIGEANDCAEHFLIAADGSAMALPGVAWHHQSDNFLDDILKRGVARSGS